MRPVETILILGVIILVYQFIYSSKQKIRLKQFIVFMVLILFFHLMSEGYRWQMIPAYFCFGFLYLRAKIGQIKFTQRFHKISWALWLLLTIALPVVVPVIDLPEPTGPYKIGTKIYHWTDSSRSEWFTPEDSNDVRELMVQVWYPAERADGNPIPYIDHLDLRADAIGRAGNIPGFLVSHIDLVETHAYLNAEPSSGKFPLLILSHGITGFRQLHTSLIEECASHGYVVVAPDHTYDCNLTVFPNGNISDYRSDITGFPDSVNIRRQQMDTRTSDIVFVLNRITHTKEIASISDFERVGVLGHSYGGATAIQFAHENNRIKAVLSLDGWMNPLPKNIIDNGISQPFLSVMRPSWDDSDYPTSPQLMKRFSQNLSEESFSYILKGSLHLDFTDIPLFTPLSGFFLETGSISPNKAVEITNHIVVTFFDYYLKSLPNHFPERFSDFQELEIKSVKK